MSADSRAVISAPGRAASEHPLFIQLAPFVFVFFWSTGFVGARYGLPYAEPFTYLSLRMIIAATMMIALALASRSAWPASWQQTGRIAISGLLLHAGYLGGVFFAIDRGMPAGISALIVGLQPILTAVFAQATLHERINQRQWLGLLLGFAGVAVVVIERMRSNDGVETSTAIAADIAILLALLSTTAGTIYQKRFGGSMPLASGTAIQYGVTAVAVGLLAVTTESMEIDWTARFVFALSWQVIVLSLLALTAIEAYLLFDERLSLAAIGGMALVVAGVALVVVKRGALK